MSAASLTVPARDRFTPLLGDTRGNGSRRPESTLLPDDPHADNVTAREVRAVIEALGVGARVALTTTRGITYTAVIKSHGAGGVTHQRESNSFVGSSSYALFAAASPLR